MGQKGQTPIDVCPKLLCRIIAFGIRRSLCISNNHEQKRWDMRIVANYVENRPTEIIPGLILGGIMDLENMISMKPDVLVPLDSLPGDVWDMGFRGDILYCPITDYSILPDDVLEKLVRQISERIKNGMRVAVFCTGGHGRTGYISACVLFQHGIKNPIEYLRENYSPFAVESREEESAVDRFCRTHAAGSMF